jgi:AraC family transcriptional activator of pobA
MDDSGKVWHFPDMQSLPHRQPPGLDPIPVWALYGENQAFPDVLHIERITDRAAGLDWRINPHRHLHLHQFFLIRDGETQISLDGQTPVTTTPFVLSIPPGVVHGFTFSAGTEGFVLTIPLQSLPDLLGTATAQETALGQPGILPADPEIEALFLRIYAEHAGTQPGRALALRALATLISCLVLRGMDRARAALGPAADPRFQTFLMLVQQHLRDNWTLADYAGVIGISERHLSRITRAATGQAAAAMIESALMREACRLLVYTRATIASVGYDLGFDDPSYFSRAFRRVIGLSPGAYRAGFEDE